MPKKNGTARVTLEVLCGSKAAADHLTKRFAPRAQRSGTVTHLTYSCRAATAHDYLVSVKFHHTCINQGNTKSDARRFVINTFKRTTYRYEVRDIRSGNWKPNKITEGRHAA